MSPSTRLAGCLVVAGMVLLSLPGLAQDSGLAPETLAQSTPVFAYPSQGNRPALVFVRSGSAQEFDPRVFTSSRDGWRLVQLPDELHNTAWVYAGRSINNDEVWGMTQRNDADGPGPALFLVSSTNGGRLWRSRGTVQKVSRFAVVELFAINEERGTLVLRLDEDPSPNAPRLGYYIYMSKNAGRTWAEPLYSQGKPLPPPSLLAAPDRSFDAKQALDAAGWQRLLADLQPAG
ncbi:MAG: hypothetical protein ACJ75H_10925 [Thermoanaerobaculia bacterium]